MFFLSNKCHLLQPQNVSILKKTNNMNLRNNPISIVYSRISATNITMHVVPGNHSEANASVFLKYLEKLFSMYRQ